jgi:O-antigen biosynthesis protein WbqP
MSNSKGWPVLRLFDIVLACVGLVLGLPLLLLIMLLGLFDTGSPLFFQTRVGRHQQPFRLVKFRTMRPDTASVATHLADPNAVTGLGRFLRRSKLDELPQLWNVLTGKMSLVGPRPCLPSQTKLIEERERRRVFEHRPGITGLAQVQGIDMSTPQLLAQTDATMLQALSTSAYFRYILLTVSGRGSGDRIVKAPTEGADR